MSNLIPNNPTAAGVNVLDAPVDLGWQDGPRFSYAGVMPWCRWGRAQKADAAVFWYRGPADTPAISSGAHGAIFDGLNLWRREYTKNLVAWDGSVGFRFADPASSTRLQNCSIAGFDIGILFAKSTHTEHFLFENLHSYANRIFFKSIENQAVAYHFQNIFQHREAEIMFQWGEVPGRKPPAGGGGNVSGDTIVMQYPGLMFDIERSQKNSCHFTWTNIKIDGGNMNGWRLLRHKAGPLSFTVRGLIGDDVQPAEDAIVTADPDGVDVKLFWRNGTWPQDFRWNGSSWEINKAK